MITLNYDFIMLCNMKCPYCFQRRSEYWKTITPKKDHELIVHQIAELDHDIHFTIIGGEPTLHPALRSFLLNLGKTEQVKEIEVYTNAFKYYDFTSLPKETLEKISLTISAHDDYSKLIHNIKRYSEIFDKDHIHLIIMMEERSEERTKDLYNELKDICDIEYNCVIDFDAETPTIHKYDPCGITLSEPHFRKGCKCKIENFDINCVGDILLMCRNQGFNIHKNTLKEVISKYLNTEIICPEEICMG